MEQIVGRIDDEYRHGEDHGVVELEDGSLLVDGSMPVDEVEELIGFKPVEAEECETAGGLLLSLFDRIPNEGDTVAVEDEGDKATFTVLDMDRHRIDKIRVIVEHAAKDEQDSK